MIKALYLLFSITLLILIATTTFAAELGAGKALKADKGPTLEQTMAFIKDNPSLSLPQKTIVISECC